MPDKFPFGIKSIPENGVCWGMSPGLPKETILRQSPMVDIL